MVLIPLPAWPFPAVFYSGTTVSGGGYNGPGSVYSLTTNGASFMAFDIFSDPGTYPEYNTNFDGFYPYGSLLVSGNTLYGAASDGGANGRGTLFSVLTNGTGFSLLYTMAGEDSTTNAASSGGSNPSSTLVLSGGTLYGVTPEGGTNSYNNGDLITSDGGTIFSVSAGGGSFVDMHAFDTEGYEPLAGLILSGGKLYGTTSTLLDQIPGSPYFFDTLPGTIFSINTDGTGYTNFYTFTNSDFGATPAGNLIISGSTLYGTTLGGGSAGEGVVFSIQTDGSGYTVLHSFSGLNGFTNADGAVPAAGLLLSGNTLYGTSQYGGVYGSGTVFALPTSGSGFSTLYSFTALDPDTFTNSDGANPSSQLVMSGSTLFGTAQNGGWYSVGTVFSLPALTPTLPALSIVRLGTNVVVTWPANLTGYTLQSTTNLAAAATWSTVSPAPVITSGKYTVTNSLSPIRRFYRLNP